MMRVRKAAHRVGLDHLDRVAAGVTMSVDDRLGTLNACATVPTCRSACARWNPAFRLRALPVTCAQQLQPNATSAMLQRAGSAAK
jgi:hypothetical protein